MSTPDHSAELVAVSAELAVLREAVRELAKVNTASHAAPWDRDLLEARTAALYRLIALVPGGG